MSVLKRNEEKKNKYLQCAFRADCEKLLTVYSKLCDLSYKSFAKIWTDMSFTSVYSGKSSYDEQRHFTEMCFFTAKKFFIFPRNLYIQVGALYLLYGLYYKQPLKDFVKIRLTKPEYAILLEVMKEVEARKQKDALYIYLKMKADCVFNQVYAQAVLAPDLRHFTDNLIMHDDIFQFRIIDDIDEQLKNVLSDDVIKISEDYRKALQAYAKTSGNTSLLTFNTNIVQELDAVYDKAMKDCRTTAGTEDISKSTEEGHIGQNRRNIKLKATKLRNVSYRYKNTN